MEQIRKFLRDKGFALALLACLVAAAAAGVWAVRTVRDELDKNLSCPRGPAPREEFLGRIHNFRSENRRKFFSQKRYNCSEL